MALACQPFLWFGSCWVFGPAEYIKMSTMAANRICSGSSVRLNGNIYLSEALQSLLPCIPRSLEK